MTRTALLLIVALGSLRDPCGTETSPVGENAPCTRTKDCENGLSCIEGVCSPADGGAEADGGSDVADSGANDASPAD